MNRRLVAFYLPQYHPIAENDAWWGTGFTEWTNVKSGRPLFPGHYQPHVPSELGYYDLRDPEVMCRQADLAREHGIHAFCYYHYWFNGQRLLGRPLDDLLSSGRPDMPFCLCWANENWTRVWDGQSTKVLIGQNYSEQDDRAHMRWLANVFRDRRYVRVAGKALFLVYRPSCMPDPRRTALVWREEARRAGLGDIFLCKVDSFQEPRFDPAEFGFDAAVEFQPDTAALLTLPEKVYWRMARRFNIQSGLLVCQYASWIRRALRQTPFAYPRIPCVAPGWDNTARRKSGGFVLHNSTPELYEGWLKAALARAQQGAAADLMFVNAWNEWAEGNHLEPCERWGRSYLQATRRAMAAST